LLHQLSAQSLKLLLSSSIQLSQISFVPVVLHIASEEQLLSSQSISPFQSLSTPSLQIVSLLWQIDDPV
jgi:hypothetical protein